MASDGAQTLPADLFHLLSEELAARADYATLYSCVTSSKYLANAGAVTALYRISLSDKSPLNGGGGDNLSFAEQDLTVMKWSILWRTIILSALGKTLYPYCRHLRELDLRDLDSLLDRLDEQKFKSKVAKHFFAGDLQQFHLVYKPQHGKYRAERLDIKRILLAVGDLLTQQAPLIEGIAEPQSSDVLSTALPSWAPRLSHLQELELWDGKALADETLRNLLHVHCSKLNQLRIHHSSGTESDHSLAGFISGMPLDALVRFENISSSSIAAETCLALNNHGKSLISLKLALEEDGILALGLLQGCSAVETLHITALRPSVDLKATQNDVFLEIVEWLQSCSNLREVSFDNVISAPDLLVPILLNNNVKLHSLTINAKENSMYVVKDNHAFHKALSSQPSLESLYLRADPDPMLRDDMDILIEAICSLPNLRDLNLYRIAEYFRDEHIVLLAQHLPNLENLYIGGYNTDAVLPSLARLKNLKALNFAGITAFTADGILGFINALGHGNEGLLLSVEMAEPDSMISEGGQDLLRDAIAAKSNGRFEYQLLRDPNVPEFDQSDSD